MRVLLVNDYEHKGGAEVVMHAQRDSLAERGHAVEIFAGDAVGLRRHAWSYVDSRSARRELRARLADFAPDVVHLHNFYHLLSPGILGELDRWKRPGRIVAMSVHDMHVVCPNPGLLMFGPDGARSSKGTAGRSGFSLFATKWDERGWAHSTLRAAQHAWNYRMHDRLSVIDVMIVPSNWAGELVGQTGRAVRVVPNPVPDRDPERGEQDPNGPWTIVFAGRVEPEKGLAGFLASLAGADGVRVRVIGDGSDLPRCRAAAERAGVPTHFLGWIEHERARREIALADALVMPSVVHENAPLAVFEALAGRTLPIVSRVGGLPEIVESFGVGEVFEPADGESVRAALDRGRANAPSDANWASVSSALRERTPERFAEALESVYRAFGCAS